MSLLALVLEFASSPIEGADAQIEKLGGFLYWNRRNGLQVGPKFDDRRKLWMPRIGPRVSGGFSAVAKFVKLDTSWPASVGHVTPQSDIFFQQLARWTRRPECPRQATEPG